MTIQAMTLVESKAREEKEAAFEFWRKSYEIALAGMCSGPDLVDPIVVSPAVARLADLALDDYRAKREEMGIWARTKNSQP